MMIRFYQKKLTMICFVVAMIGGITGTAIAFGRYTPGVLGLNAATLPPKGLHYTMYNVFYNTDKWKDDNGNSVNLGLDLSVYAMANQFLYMTDTKILGADMGFDFIVPLINVDIQNDAAGIDEDHFGIGDICIEPFVLSWHTSRLDAAFALGFYVPTAESGKPSSAGSGYWSAMETLGVTFYFDEAKTTTLSVLTRWLQNTKNERTDITSGANVVAEYGLAKTFPISKIFNITAGIAGYTYAQIGEDSGAGTTDDKYIGHAIGPELRFMIFDPFPMQISARYLFEYGVRNSTEGMNACLTLIGSF
jgi:hypothetical protein